nr:hypothetical protein CDL12_13637 [Ipomoea trifida]
MEGGRRRPQKALTSAVRTHHSTQNNNPTFFTQVVLYFGIFLFNGAQNNIICGAFGLRNATETAGDTWNDEREPRCFFYLIPHSSSLSLIGERKDEVKAVGAPRMWWAMKGTSSSMVLLRRGGLRLIADKASNRSAVHGTKIPVPDVVETNKFDGVSQKEQVEMEVERGKDDKEKKRKEVESAVDDKLKNRKVISPESSSNTS